MPADSLGLQSHLEVPSGGRETTWKPVSVPERFRDDPATDMKQTSIETEGIPQLWAAGPCDIRQTGTGAWLCASWGEQQVPGWESTRLSVASALCDFGQVLSLPWASVPSSAK